MSGHNLCLCVLYGIGLRAYTVFDACARHCLVQGGNLLVPLHGYPVMNDTKFPKKIDFKKVHAAMCNAHDV